MKNLRCLLFLFVFILYACGNVKSNDEKTAVNQSNASSPTPNSVSINTPIQSSPDSDFWLKMERKKGGGWGASYILTVESNGKILLENINYIGYKGNGKATGNISKEKMAELIDEIKKADIFSLKDAYTRDSGNCANIATDAATVILSVKIDGREKNIEQYLGCFGDDASGTSFPPKLAELENKIDEIVGTKRWIGEK